ncbi:unnamed protein product [Trichogramma brassicae]|uniref:Uncharacterized protein n=1 Tax=Trichogramma brassicae TaxID=86971 RepID=A0A6H5IZ13_9HYME|nr:unnamed protein product [Trichogramma brassicae]
MGLGRSPVKPSPYSLRSGGSPITVDSDIASENGNSATMTEAAQSTVSLEDFDKLRDDMISRVEALFAEQSSHGGAAQRGSSAAEQLALLSGALRAPQKPEIRIRSFWRSAPRIWFNTLEEHFVAKNIVDDADKYMYAISNLDEDLIATVSSAIDSASAGDRYEKLKDALVRKFTVSDSENLKNILGNVNMGTRSPSEFLEYLISSAGNILGRDTILRIWRETIPANICVHLDDVINQENESSNVRKADRIYISFRRDADSRASYGVDSIARDSVRRDDDARIHNLEQKLDRVLDSLESYRNGRNRDRRNSGRSRGQRDSRSGGRRRNHSVWLRCQFLSATLSAHSNYVMHNAIQQINLVLDIQTSAERGKEREKQQKMRKDYVVPHKRQKWQLKKKGLYQVQSHSVLPRERRVSKEMQSMYTEKARPKSLCEDHRQDRTNEFINKTTLSIFPDFLRARAPASMTSETFLDKSTESTAATPQVSSPALRSHGGDGAGQALYTPCAYTASVCWSSPLTFLTLAELHYTAIAAAASADAKTHTTDTTTTRTTTISFPELFIHPRCIIELLRASVKSDDDDDDDYKVVTWLQQRQHQQQIFEPIPLASNQQRSRIRAGRIGTVRGRAVRRLAARDDMWSSSLLLLLTAALLAAATIEPDSIQATSPTQKTSSSSSKPLTLTTIDDGKSSLDYYGRSMIFGLRDLVGSDWSRSRRSVAKPPLDRAAKQQQQMNLDMERYRRSMQQVSAGKSSPQQQQPPQQSKARNNNRTRSESAREQRRRCRLRGTCRGRNWCPDMDVGNRAYLAPTVFEGKARSMSSLRKPGSNYAVTFEVKRVYKSQAGFMPLQTNDSVRLHFRDKSGGGGGKSGLCQSVNSATTALPTTLTTSMGQGVAHNLRTSNSGTLNILDAMAAVGSGSSNGDDGMVRANIKRGKVYLVFVNRVGPRNFTILGEPVIRSKKNEQAIQAVLRPDYEKFVQRVCVTRVACAAAAAAVDATRAMCQKKLLTSVLRFFAKVICAWRTIADCYIAGQCQYLLQVRKKEGAVKEKRALRARPVVWNIANNSPVATTSCLASILPSFLNVKLFNFVRLAQQQSLGVFFVAQRTYVNGGNALSRAIRSSVLGCIISYMARTSWDFCCCSYYNYDTSLANESGISRGTVGARESVCHATPLQLGRALGGRGTQADEHSASATASPALCVTASAQQSSSSNSRHSSGNDEYRADRGQNFFGDEQRSMCLEIRFRITHTNGFALMRQLQTCIRAHTPCYRRRHGSTSSQVYSGKSRVCICEHARGRKIINVLARGRVERTGYTIETFRERFSARCATLYRTWVGRHRHRRETADSTRCCNAPREESQSMQNDNKSAAACHRPIPVAARTLTRLSFDEVHKRNIQDACTRRRHMLCSDETNFFNSQDAYGWGYVAVLRVHSPAAEDSRESRGREIVTRNHKNSCGRRRLRPKHVPRSYINSTVTLEDNNRRSSLKSIASEPHQVCLAESASRLAFPFRPQFCIACAHRAREQQRPLYLRPQILRFLPPGGTFFMKRSSVRKKQRRCRLLTLCCCNGSDDIATYTRAKRICICGTPQVGARRYPSLTRTPKGHVSTRKKKEKKKEITELPRYIYEYDRRSHQAMFRVTQRKQRQVARACSNLFCIYTVT